MTANYMYGFGLSDPMNGSRWQEQIIHPCDNNNCCSGSSPPRCIHIPTLEVQNKTESDIVSWNGIRYGIFGIKKKQTSSLILLFGMRVLKMKH
ncbi:hypothetical protein FH972_000306 [Carpinus fangiana]|uniref:Uncharacterized protein n=1 Tax=Carpinus fangiana TaxID=176857 RepID=A0A5N6Q8H7_9ROSI|nr:hypothetical protein FH972_000306 [Carpinus fangiana]